MKFDEYVKMLLETETVSDDPSYNEMHTFLKPKAKKYEADEMDVEAAIYWYSSDYHSGQKSNLYSALSKSDYKPGRMSKGISSEGFAAIELYNELCSKFGGTVVESKIG